MTDFFVTVGRTFNNLNFGITAIVSLGLIAGGLYLLLNKNTDPNKVDPNIPAGSPSQPAAIAMILFGSILLSIAWSTRKAIQTNRTFARIVGVLDIFNLFK